ncbi:MAG: hypothetical protein ACOVOD_03565, partial [Rhodoferax sp.]
GSVRTLRAGTWAEVTQSTLEGPGGMDLGLDLDMDLDGGAPTGNSDPEVRRFLFTHVQAVGINNLPKELQAQVQGLPRVMATWQVQQDLFKSRRSALQADLAAMQESLSGLSVQMQALEESKASKLLQQKSLSLQLEGMR